ncbi:MAG: hypothetical protein IBJ07_05305 [Rhizobiaceae bacterium]|nr:hypothetical protein [Rhizobiaceae bacterium]
MPRALTVIIAFHWAALLCLSGARTVAAPGTAALGDVIATGAVAAIQFIAALAFFWAMVSVLTGSDSEEAGQGNVAKIAIAVGLLATTAGAIRPALAGDVAVLQLGALQFAGLLVSHLIMQAERPVVRTPVGANDNSRAAARLLAMLAATDAKINRMTRQGAGTPGDFWR